GGIKDNDSKIKIQDHYRANDHSNEFPRTRLQVSRKEAGHDVTTEINSDGDASKNCNYNITTISQIVLMLGLEIRA
nr:hypothetical protein [Tanacetum cinerariifolium]